MIRGFMAEGESAGGTGELWRSSFWISWSLELQLRGLPVYTAVGSCARLDWAALEVNA